ncbi:hypothetical protein GCM10027592_56640 [Spirosoma flavus]
MTLYEFNLLPSARQVDWVWEKGTFLVRRDVGRLYLMLFAVNSFFVEIRFDQDLREVTACRSFRSLVPLEPYLEIIQINSI